MNHFLEIIAYFFSTVWYVFLVMMWMYMIFILLCGIEQREAMVTKEAGRILVQVSRIPNRYRRRLAIVLTFPVLIVFTCVVYSVAYVIQFVKQLKIVFDSARETW